MFKQAFFNTTLVIALMISSCSHQNQGEPLASKHYPSLAIYQSDKIINHTVDASSLLEKSDFLLFRGNLENKTFILALNKNKNQFEISLQIQDKKTFLVSTKTDYIEKKAVISLLSNHNSKLQIKDLFFSTTQPLYHTLNPDGSGHLTISLAIPKMAKTPVKFQSSFKVMSLNPLQLWDNNPSNTSEEQLYIYDLFRPEFSNWYDPKIQRARAKNILKMIELGELPEIITFQEIESADNQSEVFKKGTPLREGLEKLGYKHFAIGLQEKDNPVSLTTAVVSRFPIKNNSFIPFNINLPHFKDISSKDKYSIKFTTRDIQVVDLSIFDQSFKIYVNHWRSQGCHSQESCETSEKVRIINAKLVHEHAQNELKKNPQLDLLIIGDLNTSLHQRPLNYLKSTNQEELVQSGIIRDGFYNLWYELPASKRWEATHQGIYSNLSHALIPYTLFDTQGIQYADKSYGVLGQNQPQSQFLINGDGNPFRLQEERIETKYLSKDIAGPIEKILNARNCHQKKEGKRKNRRCYSSYTRFSELGYSDHLPLFLDLNYVGLQMIPLQTRFTPSKFQNDQEDRSLNVEVIPCKNNPEEIQKYSKGKDLNLYDPSNLSKCIVIDQKQSPLPLLTTGIYDTNYIDINGQKLALSFTRAFDPRKIANGKPLGVIEDKDFENTKTAPMESGSHMCFTRKILQGSGGKLQFAVGRLGYLGGLATLYVDDLNDIILIDLPDNKKKACREMVNSSQDPLDEER